MTTRTETLLAFTIFLTLACIFHWSSVIRPETDIGKGGDKFTDGMFHAWALDWTTKALLDPHRSLFDAPLFAPNSKTLAYSEHMIGEALVTMPLTMMSGLPLLSVNILIVFSTALCGWSTFMLVRGLGGSSEGALLAGLIAALAPTRLLHAPGHPHVLMLWWIPLCLLWLHRYHITRAPRWLWYFGAGIVGQGLFSLHGLLFLLIAFVIVATVYGWKMKQRWQWWGAVAATIAGALLLLTPILLPYFQLSRDTHFKRPPGEHIAFSISFLDFVIPPAFMSKIAVEYNVGPGMTPLILLVLLGSAAGAVRGRQRGTINVSTTASTPLRSALVSYTLVGAIGLLCALGPELHLAPESTRSISGPFWLLSGLPGFSGIRAIGRFTQLTLLSIAVIIGLLWDTGVARIRPQRRQWMWIGVATLLLAEFLATMPKTFALNPALLAPRPLDSWLALQPAQCIIAELPFNDLRNEDNESVLFLYATRFHGKRIVNGYSGFSPEGYRALELLLFSVRAIETLPEIVRLGTDIIILHPSLYPDEYRAQVLQDFRASKLLKPLTSFPDSEVFLILKEKSCL